MKLGGVGMRVLGRDDVPEKVRAWSVGHGMGERVSVQCDAGRMLYTGCAR